jgi:hypothetical protein
MVVERMNDSDDSKKRQDCVRIGLSLGEGAHPDTAEDGKSTRECNRMVMSLSLPLRMIDEFKTRRHDIQDCERDE